jgi:Flp pilus assembly pilin Flp
MSEQMNTPMLPPPSGMAGWFSVWKDAVTKPNEQTFAQIAQSPEAKLTTALLWIFLGSLVNLLVTFLVQGAVMSQALQNSDFGGQSLPGGAAGNALITAVCGAPIAAVISVALFALLTGVVQLVAKMFGGRGTFDQLAYALAAILTPFYIVSALLTLLAAIPFVGACFGIVALGVGIYVLVLEVMAVKGVNLFGWGQAIASLLLPAFVLGCCIAVGVFGILQALGPAISDTFESLQQSLP